MAKQLIRFDWAIKKLLRDKANFDILEGFLTVLLNEPIKIDKILESESNKETEGDRHNRVDILVRNQQGEFIIIEVQNSKEYDYFHRMIYGTAKVISEYIEQGEPYSNVRKVISITIAYFDLGQGKDYVYHGTNVFYGIHEDDVLTLADKQQELYARQAVHEIFPEYWIIKAGKFDNQVSDKLDEWIYFLKNSEIKEEFTAPGLSEAKEKLKEMNMNEEERLAYKRYLRRLMDIASERYTERIDYEDKLNEYEQKGMKKGIEEGIKLGIEQGIEARDNEVVMRMYARGMTNNEIATLTGLSEARVEEIIKNSK